MASRAAANGEAPRSRRRPMSSHTTMASSTTRPEASTIPNRLRVLIELPESLIRVMDPNSDTGTARALIRARRLLPSPSSRVRNTSTTASRRLPVASEMLSRTVSASLTINCRSIPGGNRCSSSAMACSSRSLTSRALLPSRW